MSKLLKIFLITEPDLPIDRPEFLKLIYRILIGWSLSIGTLPAMIFVLTCFFYKPWRLILERTPILLVLGCIFLISLTSYLIYAYQCRKYHRYLYQKRNEEE